MIFIVLALVVRGKDFIFPYFHFTQGVWCSTMSSQFSCASPLCARLYLGTDASLHIPPAQFECALASKVDLLLDCTVLFDCSKSFNTLVMMKNHLKGIYGRGEPCRLHILTSYFLV